jgi:hypothetical protein
MIFGESGSKIVAKNIIKNNGELNFLTKGKRIVGVFGICKIENFE